MQKEKQMPISMDNYTLAQLQGVFSIHTSNLTLQSLDLVFLTALGSNEFEDAMERQLAIESWKCLKIILTAIQTGKHPKTIKRVKMSVE